MSNKSVFLYEQYRLGELSAKECRHLESEPDFSYRIAELESSDQEILSRYPAASMAEAIRTRAGKERSGEESGNTVKTLLFSLGRIAVPLAAAAALILTVVFVFPVVNPASNREAELETARPKGITPPESIGKPEMVLYRNSGTGVEILRDGDTAVEHDLLQVGFIGGGSWWGSIFSVDGNGVVTRHWPMDGLESIPLGNTSEFLLPFSYELDDAPSFEVFFLIWSDSAYLVEDVKKLLSGYDGSGPIPDTDSLNPTGKTGVTAIKVLKSP